MFEIEAVAEVSESGELLVKKLKYRVPCIIIKEGNSSPRPFLPAPRCLDDMIAGWYVNTLYRKSVVYNSAGYYVR